MGRSRKPLTSFEVPGFKSQPLRWQKPVSRCRADGLTHKLEKQGSICIPSPPLARTSFLLSRGWPNFQTRKSRFDLYRGLPTGRWRPPLFCCRAGGEPVSCCRADDLMHSFENHRNIPRFAKFAIINYRPFGYEETASFYHCFLFSVVFIE